MKTIGLIGGTGWVSSTEYYKQINQKVNNRLGGLEAARCLLYSLNYGDIDRFNQKKDDKAVLELLKEAARKLEMIGVDCVVLCANTLHFYADDVKVSTKLPLLHIGEATAQAIAKERIGKIALLGTKTTMEEDFYTSKLKAHNIDALVPEAADRDYIHKTIMSELLRNRFLYDSKNNFLEIIDKLQKGGAEAVVLGCTEIPLLIHQDDIDIPLFNTLSIHTDYIVDFALNGNA